MRILNMFLCMRKTTDWIDLDSIDKEAKRVLDELGIAHEPVDTSDIAQRLGYTVRAAAFPDQDLAGQISNRSGDVVIDVSGFDSKPRQRFTIAHEIGHAILHLKNWKGSFVDTTVTLNRRSENSNSDLSEMAANRFGAALLMPKEWIEKAVSDSLSIDQLASRFGVSISAVTHRLNSLGLVSKK